MEHAFTLAAVFAVFIPALALPGPDFVAVVRASLTNGARAGLMTTLGVTAGLCLYATLSLVGLSALLAEFAWLTWAVRAVGGAYLVWLGIRLLRAPPQDLGDVSAAPPSPRRAALFGFVVTLTNPKAIVLFASVFATAVTPSTPFWLMALMVGLVGAAALGWYVLVSVFVASPPVARRFARSRRWVERAAGGCFLALGGKLLVDTRNSVAP